MPQISVLMSVYNGERFLSEAVESIINQSFQDFEFIIINDGSTDKSTQILNEYAEKDNRIVLINQKNKGLVASLNTGISQAKAPLIARMDADDISLPDRLLKQKEFMDDHPNIGVLGSAIISIDAEGNQGNILQYPRKGAELDHYIYHHGSPLAHPAVIMQRDLVIQAGGYREEFKHAEDYDLWLRLHKITTIDNLVAPLLKYRTHDEKISVHHAQSQALASIIARYIAKHDVDHCDFDKVRENMDIAARNQVDWEIIDVMAGSLLFSPNTHNLVEYNNKVPDKILNDNKEIAVRVFLKFMFVAIKIKKYQLAIKYFMKSLCISPYKTLALVIEKTSKRMK